MWRTCLPVLSEVNHVQRYLQWAVWNRLERRGRNQHYKIITSHTREIWIHRSEAASELAELVLMMHIWTRWANLGELDQTVCCLFQWSSSFPAQLQAESVLFMQEISHCWFTLDGSKDESWKCVKVIRIYDSKNSGLKQMSQLKHKKVFFVFVHDQLYRDAGANAGRTESGFGEKKEKNEWIRSLWKSLLCNLLQQHEVWKDGDHRDATVSTEAWG